MKSKVFIIKFLYTISNILGFEKSARFVLCYHSLDGKSNKYSISMNDFKKQILEFKKYNEFVSLDEILKSSEDAKMVALTFDDGYRDLLLAKDFLKRENIPAAVFVLSNTQKANRKELNHSGKFLTIDELKLLHKEGWIVGCHSAIHADFEKLSDNDIEQEVVESKKTLERNLGFKIKYFAYPKGISNEKIIASVKKAGFSKAFSANAGLITTKRNKYKIPRFVMENNGKFSVPFSFSNAAQILRNLIY